MKSKFSTPDPLAIPKRLRLVVPAQAQMQNRVGAAGAKQRALTAPMDVYI